MRGNDKHLRWVSSPRKRGSTGVTKTQWIPACAGMTHRCRTLLAAPQIGSRSALRATGMTTIARACAGRTTVARVCAGRMTTGRACAGMTTIAQACAGRTTCRSGLLRYDAPSPRRRPGPNFSASRGNDKHLWWVSSPRKRGSTGVTKTQWIPACAGMTHRCRTPLAAPQIGSRSALRATGMTTEQAYQCRSRAGGNLAEGVCRSRAGGNPCMDAPGLSIDWGVGREGCAHVFGLLVRLGVPLATMESADRRPISVATAGWVDPGLTLLPSRDRLRNLR